MTVEITHQCSVPTVLSTCLFLQCHPTKGLFPADLISAMLLGRCDLEKQRETIKSNQLKIMLFHIRIESHKLTVKNFFFRFEKKTSPVSEQRQLPVTKSQTRIRASSRPAMTHVLACEMASDTVLHDGFHFLNNVPLCRSYTMIKLGEGS